MQNRFKNHKPFYISTKIYFHILGPEFTHSLYTASISRAELTGALGKQFLLLFEILTK